MPDAENAAISEFDDNDRNLTNEPEDDKQPEPEVEEEENEEKS